MTRLISQINSYQVKLFNELWICLAKIKRRQLSFTLKPSTQMPATWGYGEWETSESFNYSECLRILGKFKVVGDVQKM